MATGQRFTVPSSSALDEFQTSDVRPTLFNRRHELSSGTVSTQVTTVATCASSRIFSNDATVIWTTLPCSILPPTYFSTVSPIVVQQLAPGLPLAHRPHQDQIYAGVFATTSTTSSSWTSTNRPRPIPIIPKLMIPTSRPTAPITTQTDQSQTINGTSTSRSQLQITATMLNSTGCATTNLTSGSTSSTATGNTQVQVSCDCKTLCLRKGCPCRNIKQHCTAACTCKGNRTKPCQNRADLRIQSSSKRGNDTGPSEVVNEQRQEIDVRGLLTELQHDQLLEVAIEAFETRKSLLTDILNRRNSSGVPNPQPPSFGHVVPEWCKCGRCRQMPKEKERKCCKRRHCLTLDQSFSEICLNSTILEVAVNSRSDICVEQPNLGNRNLRHTGYRQFVMWQHGPLGAGNRVVIPSCCVWRIRTQFPSADNNYTGYRDHQLNKMTK